MAASNTLLDARALDRTLRRMADEILELNDGTDDLVIVGIQRRGVQLAARIVSGIAERENAKVPTLDASICAFIHTLPSLEQRAAFRLRPLHR